MCPIKCFYILCSVSNVAMVSLLTLLYVLRSFHKMFFNILGNCYKMCPIKCFYILCSVSNVVMVSWLTLLYVLRSFWSSLLTKMSFTDVDSIPMHLIFEFGRHMDALKYCRQLERRRSPKLANVGCVEWKWSARRWRWWEAQISSSGWHHHSTWVKTHTTLFTPMFFEERSHLFPHDLPTHVRWHTEILGWCVCLGDMYLRFIHLFIYCAIHLIPITFR